MSWCDGRSDREIAPVRGRCIALGMNWAGWYLCRGIRKLGETKRSCCDDSAVEADSTISNSGGIGVSRAH